MLTFDESSSSYHAETADELIERLSTPASGCNTPRTSFALTPSEVLEAAVSRLQSNVPSDYSCTSSDDDAIAFDFSAAYSGPVDADAPFTILRAAMPNVCLKCGASDHETRSCTQERTCFLCGGVGHESAHCPSQYCLSCGEWSTNHLPACPRALEASHSDRQLAADRRPAAVCGRCAHLRAAGRSADGCESDHVHHWWQCPLFSKPPVQCRICIGCGEQGHGVSNCNGQFIPDVSRPGPWMPRLPGRRNFRPRQDGFRQDGYRPREDNYRRDSRDNYRDNRDSRDNYRDSRDSRDRAPVHRPFRPDPAPLIRAPVSRPQPSGRSFGRPNAKGNPSDKARQQGGRGRR